MGGVSWLTMSNDLSLSGVCLMMGVGSVSAVGVLRLEVRSTVSSRSS